MEKKVKNKTTSKALAAGILSIMVCVAMLLGTTFAWFTSTVTNTGNKINAGGVAVRLLKFNGSDYVDISNSTQPVFNDELIAGDGGVVKGLMVKNVGTITAEYNIKFNNINLANSQGLEEYLEVYNSEAGYVGTLEDILNGDTAIFEGTLVKAQSEAFTITVKLPASTPIEVLGGSIENFDIVVNAWQQGGTPAPVANPPVIKEGKISDTNPTTLGTKTATVEIPAGAIAGAVDGDDVALTILAGNANIEVDGDEANVASVDLSLTLNGDPVTTFVTPVIVKMVIEAGLIDVTVRCGSEEMTVISYNPVTGELEFETTHFSLFEVSVKAVEVKTSEELKAALYSNEDIVIYVEAGTYNFTVVESNAAYGKKAVIGKGANNTIINISTTDPAWRQAVLLFVNSVAMKNVTVNTASSPSAYAVNVIGKSSSEKDGEFYAVFENVVINGCKGFNIGGVKDAKLTNVTVGKFANGCAGLSVASSNVEVIDCDIAYGGWGNVAIMHREQGDSEPDSIYQFFRPSTISIDEATLNRLTYVYIEGYDFNGDAITGVESWASGVGSNVMVYLNSVATVHDGYEFNAAYNNLVKTGRLNEIYMLNGEYNTQLALTHDVTIVGESRDGVIVNGAVDYDTMTSFAANVGATSNYRALVVLIDCDVTLKNITIKGNLEQIETTNRTFGFAGIGISNSSLNADNIRILDITYAIPNTRGLQNGFGIYAETTDNTKTITITNSEIKDFNKGAAVIRAGFAEFVFTDNVVEGFGEQVTIGQNGIQFSCKATITGNTFTGLSYVLEGEWYRCSVAVYFVRTDLSISFEDCVIDNNTYIGVDTDVEVYTY